MADQWDTEVIPAPNWEEHIKFLFSDGDIQCMGNVGQRIRLDHFESVRFSARKIYGVTEAGTMPMGDPSRRWNEFRLGTFYNWIKNGSPRTGEDETVLEKFRLELNVDGPVRKRKDISKIDPNGEEMGKLKAAFQGIMDRDPGQPNSYFDIASVHWFPIPATYCRHGEDVYNPWHRAYLLAFENALRSVPGCEDVTLPYWDIGSGIMPDVLFEKPFNEYKFQANVMGEDRLGREFWVARVGETTKRNSKNSIEAAINSPINRIRTNIDSALKADTWLSFNGLPPFANNIIGAHNTGHRICGETLRVADIAAFDPLFWFFHCNWDRLWWEWQRNAKVQRLSDFEAFMENNGEESNWLSDPISGLIEPFGVLAEVTIDSLELGVDYELTPSSADSSVTNVWTAEGFGNKRLMMANTSNVMVRLEGFERLGIAGSVLIELIAGDEVIATHDIFQSTVPESCPTCRKNARVNIDFEVTQSVIQGQEITTRVTEIGAQGKQAIVPLENVGNPSLSIRMPLDAIDR